MREICERSGTNAGAGSDGPTGRRLSPARQAPATGEHDPPFRLSSRPKNSKLFSEDLFVETAQYNERLDPFGPHR